jgi:hypothetical protein
MDSKFVRQYFTQDLSFDEKKSYLEYINGNELSTEWIKKASIRREPLLIALSCQQCHVFLPNGESCKGFISARENGVCKCTFGHDCLDVVVSVIKKIIS